MTRNVKWDENLKNGSEGKEVLGIALESRVAPARMRGGRVGGGHVICLVFQTLQRALWSTML